MPALLHNRAQVGVYSSPAHRDPTSVTEPCTMVHQSSSSRGEETRNKEQNGQEAVNTWFLNQASWQPSLNEMSSLLHPETGQQAGLWIHGGPQQADPRQSVSPEGSILRQRSSRLPLRPQCKTHNHILSIKS